MAHYKLHADIKNATGDIYDDHFDNPYQCVFGWIEDDNGNKLDTHVSSTLEWLEHDLLNDVGFNKDTDTYEKNW